VAKYIYKDQIQNLIDEMIYNGADVYQVMNALIETTLDFLGEVQKKKNVDTPIPGLLAPLSVDSDQSMTTNR
jgi:hypothetical protein